MSGQQRMRTAPSQAAAATYKGVHCYQCRLNELLPTGLDRQQSGMRDLMTKLRSAE